MEAINACSHHGFDTWLLVSYFYDGMSSSMKQLLKTMCGGNFMSKNLEEAMDFLSYVAEVSRGWDEPNAREVGKMNSQPKALNAKVGMYTLNEDTDTKEKFATMARRLEELEVTRIREEQAISDTPMQAKSCSICQSFEHLTEECLMMPTMREMFGDQENVMTTTKKVLFYSFQSNSEDFSSNDERLGSSSLGVKKAEQENAQIRQENAQIRQEIANRDKNMDGRVNDISQKIDNLQYQISRLTNLNIVQEKEKFPSQPHQNPKGIHEVEAQEGESSHMREFKAVIILMSGKEVDLPTSKPKPEPENEAEKEKMEENKEKRKENSTKKEDLEANVNEKLERTINQEEMIKKHMPPPFPQALHGQKGINNASEILELLRQCKSLVKYKDPSCPTISVMIGETCVEKALLDLRASVNLLPYSVYNELGLGELKPTSITLSLADRFVKIPRGMIEDVLVQVDKFYYPMDFIVLDMDLVAKGTNCIPIILGRPFLTTSNAIINCRNEVM
uniref:Retrotransposon gag domain-containing protein n=1 Tax=Vitis vinifera TaxID=29760 RepID=A5AXR6_VITVI|nr:hypothetical protein VITISV_043656 [Vitis vinifera]